MENRIYKNKFTFKGFVRGFLGDNFFYNNINEIKMAVADCASFLDLGCGNNSPYLRYLQKKGHKAIGVDLYADVQDRYDEIIRRDVLAFIKTLPEKSFEAVLAFDVVEHFKEADAWDLIREMERVAAKCVVIVTPNGFWPGMVDGPGMAHLCGISSSEFDNLGYKVYGAGGMAFLRSRKHSFMKGLRSLKLLPLQMIFFNLGQLLAKRNPNVAYGLCAIKTIGAE